MMLAISRWPSMAKNTMIDSTASTSAIRMRTVTGVTASPSTGAPMNIARMRQNGHQIAVSIGSSWARTGSMWGGRSGLADQGGGAGEDGDAEIHQVAGHPAA